MSGIFASLSSAAQALNAQTVAIAVTSKNIANVSNPNYSRQYVVFGSPGEVQTAQGVQEMGLEAMSVQQDSDAILNQQVIRELGLTASATAQQNWLQQAQAGLGQSLTSTASSASSSSTTTGDGGLASALDTLMTGFTALAAQPNDNGTRESLLQQAQTLTQTFNSVDQNLAQVQANAGVQITSNVTTANGLLSNIASLNSQIAAAEVNLPGSAVDLRDTREADLEQLGGIIPVTVTAQSNGEDTVTTPDTGGTGIVLVQEGTVPGALSYANGAVTGGSAGATLGLTSGSIAGALAASTGPVQTLRDNLDSLAAQLVTSVNAAYNPSSTAGGDFFVASGLTAGTIALNPSLNATTLTTGTGGAGDNSIATAVAALASTTFATSGGDAIDGTFSSYYAGVVGTLGQALTSTTANLDDQTNIQTLVENQRSSLSGVNMDQEMSNLVQYQRAYQASSEVFNILDQLLGTVINQLGANG
jgi:flagellar hook-associated protein 1 FlgK